jgi:hypothetical protein
MTPQESGPADRGSVIAWSIVVLIVMAFSDDLVEGIFRQPSPWIVIAVDVGFLLIAAALIWVGQIETRRIDIVPAGICYTAGAVLTLVTDLYIAINRPAAWYPLWTAAAYYLAFLLLVLPAIGVNPAHLRKKDSASRERFALGLPLLVGTFGAYIASIGWRWTDTQKCG